jgi:hypothetical protein
MLRRSVHVRAAAAVAPVARAMRRTANPVLAQATSTSGAAWECDSSLALSEINALLQATHSAIRLALLPRRCCVRFTALAFASFKR